MWRAPASFVAFGFCAIRNRRTVLEPPGRWKGRAVRIAFDIRRRYRQCLATALARPLFRPPAGR